MQTVRRPLAIIASSLAVLLIALTAFTARAVISVVETQRIQEAASTWLDDSNYTLVEVEFRRGGYLIHVVGEGPLPSQTIFENSFSPVLWLRPTVSVEAVTGTTQTIDVASTPD